MMDRDRRLVQTICVPDPNSPHAQYLYRKDGGLMKGGAPNIFNLLTEPMNGRFTEHPLQDIVSVSSIKLLNGKVPRLSKEPPMHR